MATKRVKILGDNIRAERMRKKYTQSQMAELVDISRESLVKIENGKQTPSAFIVFDIANALDISYEDYLKMFLKQRIKDD